MKFDSLVEKTRGLGIEHVATGHYARKDVDPATGRHRLLQGARTAPRTSRYFLFGLAQDQLAARRLPGGRPEQGRGPAARRASGGLPTADKPESQEICFVPDGDYAAFVERQAPAPADRSGPDRRPRGAAPSAATRASTASPSASASGLG